MAVFATRAFQKIFSSPEDLAIFKTAFSNWKAGWPTQEYSSEYFGKDGGYSLPKVGGHNYRLRHVHLKPLEDTVQLAIWMKAFWRRSRKTSNRALIYAHNGRGNYLLIFILPEPDAHAVAQMRTRQNATLMEGFAAVAAAFHDDGSIIA